MTEQEQRTMRRQRATHAGAGREKPLMAIQAGAISFADEGIPQVLDIFREQASINALFFAASTYTRGTGGRQVPGHPLPDHGVQEYHEFYGGNFARTHPEFYRKTAIQDFEAPDNVTRGRDWPQAILPACQERGIDVYA
jgi:hypothetical protein